MKINGSNLEEKSPLKLDLGSLHYLCCQNCLFLSSKVALYLYKSTIRPCMERCCHTCPGAPGFYLDMLDKLQK